MGRGIRRLIVICALAAGVLVVAMATIVIRTRPYERPVIALEPSGQDASFEGIRQLITDANQHGSVLHLLWIHGMCTHELNWATDRATRIAMALGGAATQTAIVEETDGLTRIMYQIHTPGGDFDATFILWSPMTQPFKHKTRLRHARK